MVRTTSGSSLGGLIDVGKGWKESGASLGRCAGLHARRVASFSSRPTPKWVNIWPQTYRRSRRSDHSSMLCLYVLQGLLTIRPRFVFSEVLSDIAKAHVGKNLGSSSRKLKNQFFSLDHKKRASMVDHALCYVQLTTLGRVSLL